MREITPKQLQCGVGLCPALFELDDGRIVVIGELPDPLHPLPAEILNRIGDNEMAVVIPPNYLKDLEL